MYNTKEELFMAIIKKLPYPEQITELEFLNDNEVRFIWRGTRFRVGINGDVDEVEGSFLKCTNIAILFSALLKL